MPWFTLISIILTAYLIGAVPFGLLLTRLAGTQDLRKIGSGNIGATNVLRTGRKDLAALTLLLDSSKGALVVFSVGLYFSRDLALWAGIAAFLGHLYPVYLGFKGGKGVATGFGVLLMMNAVIALFALAAWLVIAFVFRLSSLAALGAMFAALLATLALKLVPTALVPAFIDINALDKHFLLALFTMVCLSLYKHRSNITRLLAGREMKIDAR